MRPIQNSQLLGAIADALYEQLAGGPDVADERGLQARVRMWIDERERNGELWETEIRPMLQRLARDMLADWDRKP